MGSYYVPMNLHSSPIECPFVQMKHLGSWENEICAAWDEREDEPRVALHERVWSTMSVGKWVGKLSLSSRTNEVRVESETGIRRLVRIDIPFINKNNSKQIHDA
jgi:hypothetical protein